MAAWVGLSEGAEKPSALTIFSELDAANERYLDFFLKQSNNNRRVASKLARMRFSALKKTLGFPCVDRGLFFFTLEATARQRPMYYRYQKSTV